MGEVGQSKPPNTPPNNPDYSTTSDYKSKPRDQSKPLEEYSLQNGGENSIRLLSKPGTVNRIRLLDKPELLNSIRSVNSIRKADINDQQTTNKRPTNDRG